MHKSSKFSLNGNSLNIGKLPPGVLAEERMVQDTVYTVTIHKVNLNIRNKFEDTERFCMRLPRRI